MSLNSVNLMGRLTRDPELRYTSNNTPVASFSLAVERYFAGKDGGERQTDFIDCVAWRQTAEFVSKYFKKGNQMAVSGRLQTRDWTDKDNKKRKATEVIVENVYFCESKKSSDSQAGSAPQASGSAPQSSTGGFAPVDDDGELPF